MKAKKRRSKEARLIKKAVQSGDIQKDPIEDYYLDPYGRPIVQMLNEAPVETLGYKDRDLAADALNVLGVAAREGLGMLPVVGETLDAAEVAHSAKYGTDYYGDEVSPELLGGLTAAGYLVPNIIERPIKALGRAAKKGYKAVKNKVSANQESLPAATASEKIISAGERMKKAGMNEESIEGARGNLMSFVNSDEYKDRAMRSYYRMADDYNEWATEANRMPTTRQAAEDYAGIMQGRAASMLENTEPFVEDATTFAKRDMPEELESDGRAGFAGLAIRESKLPFGVLTPSQQQAMVKYPEQVSRNLQQLGPKHTHTESYGPSIILDPKAERSTAAHEFGHTSMSIEDILNAEESIDTPKIKDSSRKDLEGRTIMGRDYSEYLNDPDEVRARAFEAIDAAIEMDVTTDELVDEFLSAQKARSVAETREEIIAAGANYDKIYKAIPRGLRTLLEHFDPDEVRSYLKKVYSALPIAGAGAVAATRMGSVGEEPASYAKGGIMKAVKRSAKSGKIKPKKRNYKKEYKKFQSSDKMKKYRAKLNKYNRDNGTYGNGDSLDASHRGGRIAGYEAESKNRGRREKSRIRKNK